MPLIQHNHLAQIATRPDGHLKFGEMVRRLVYATTAKRRPNATFLAGEVNNQAGWDAWVEVPAGDDESPRHRSVWELSTQERAETKVRTDHATSLTRDLPSGWSPSGVIYVAATLRKLTQKAKAKLKRDLLQARLKHWQGVVILDAQDFVEWIEKVPSVESWIAEEFQLGLGRFGASLEAAWRSWSGDSRPAISRELVLAGRDFSPLVSALRFNTSPSASVLVDSAREAVALVYCAIKSLPEADAAQVLSRSLVVSDPRLADALTCEPVGADAEPVTILVPPATQKSEALVRHGHRVIHAFGRSNEHPAVLDFDRANLESFRRALAESMGLDAAEAEATARACGRSVSIWRIYNLYEKNLHQGVLPAWAQVAPPPAVVPAIFLGGWSEASKPDSAVIKRISGLNPNDFSRQLHPFAQCDDPLIEVIGDERAVVAPVAAFAFVSRHITKADLERLAVVCRSLFSTQSPEVMERWEGRSSESRIKRKSEELSDWILDGLAETLLRIAVLDRWIKASGALVGYASGQAFVDSLVRDLPGLSKDPRVMASLDQQLPYLAEAAPVPFLDALESLLQGDSAQLRIWMQDEGGLFSRSFHTGLLWALETLAWSPDYLAPVALVLARLAELDPGGQLSNRPINSLSQIFLAWHLGTSASLDKRAEVIVSLMTRVPSVAWTLLIQLLPGERRTATPTHMPKWRDFGQYAARRLTRADVGRTYQTYVDLAIKAAGRDVLRLSELVTRYNQLSSEHRARLLDTLQAVPQGAVSDEDRLHVWSQLHDLVARHRGFATASWALPPNELARLDGVAELFLPKDAVDKHRWLFDSQLPDTGHRDDDFAGREADLHARRQQAILEILALNGLAGIDRLVNKARYAHIVGSEVARVVDHNRELLDAMDTWLGGGSQAELMAFRSASAARLDREGEAWTNDLLAHAKERQWPLESTGRALIDFPMTATTLRIVETLGGAVSETFWRERYAYLHVDEADTETLRKAMERLVVHGRAADVIDLNRPLLQRLGYSMTITVLDAMIDQMADCTPPSNSGAFDYDIKELFDWLRRQPEADQVAIARREWALLPFLREYGAKPSELALHRLLASDPEFFVEVLCLLYKPKSPKDSGKRVAADDQAKRRAHAAFDLLSSWRTPPGLGAGGTVDSAALDAWIARARTLAVAQDRAEVADQEIGKVLFHLPIDPSDGGWPHLALRELLERIQSENAEVGLRTEAINSRGVVHRGLDDGGAQERELEAMWRDRARFLGSRWPRARSICASLAEDFRLQAEREDDDVRKRHSQWSR